MGDLEGRAAIVTGAAGGLGRAIAQALAGRGARLALVDRDADGLASGREAVGDGHVTITADLSSRAEVERCVGEAVDALGSLRILVNNAALIVARSVVDCSEEEYDAVMAVNVKAPFFAIQAAIPHMLAGGGGEIVNVASISALVGLPEQSVYCASKGALLQLTRQVAVDYASRGIRCNAVCPGTIQTPLLDRFVASSADPEATRRSLLDNHPVGRFSAPSEVADVVAFLASDQASFVHGAAYSVDGGYVAR